MASLKSYPAVYTKDAYESRDLKHLMHFIWAADLRAAIVNIFELANIEKWVAQKREENVEP